MASICSISVALESALGGFDGRKIDEVDTGIATAVLRTTAINASNMQAFEARGWFGERGCLLLI